VLIEEFRRFYNEERPHSSLGYLTPKEFRETIELAQLQGATQHPGALPLEPRDLTPLGTTGGIREKTKDQKAKAFPLASTVRCISAALGSLPSVALSSDEMPTILPTHNTTSESVSGGRSFKLEP
jgi:hypothetical protein